MSAFRELYQEMIVDHGRHPRNCHSMADPSHQKEGFNPLCGDRLTVFCQLKDGMIEDMSFEGQGCAISMASASMMTQALKGKSMSDAENFFQGFHDLVTGHPSDADLGKLAVFQGVSEFPARVKCASLAWHTMIAALNNDQSPVSTES